ncbi:MAG: hypothetical protein EAZ07_02145 [Cytophagales bacterium]|nr:MAG: hypothetical protein EAZ07_02145 [Cytophagales bacterium]
MLLIHEIKTGKLSDILNKISLILLVAVVVTLPFQVKLNSICIILFSVSILINLGIKGVFQRLSFLNYLFISFFALHCIGMIYTSNLKAGGFELEKKLALIIFPLFLGVFQINKEQFSKVLLGFVISCFIGITYLFLVAFTKYLIFDHSAYFFIGRFTGPLNGIHRVYLAMYFVFSISCCIYFIKDRIFPQIANLWFFLAIFCFSVGVFLVSARMSLFVYLILMIRYLYSFLYVRKNYVLGIIVIIVMVASFSFIVNNTRMLGKITEVFRDLDKGNSKRNTSSANLRVIKWKSAVRLYFDNLLIGVGTGDASDELVSLYAKENFFWGLKHRYNAHNEFLEIAVTLGTLGLILWLAILLIPLWLSLKYNQYLYIEFIFIFASCSFTESMLNAQKGVIFYALFNTLFFVQITKVIKAHKQQAIKKA